MNVTAAVTDPAAGAAGLVMLKLQLVVPCAGRVVLAQLETGIVCADCPEIVTLTAEIVVVVATVF